MRPTVTLTAEAFERLERVAEQLGELAGRRVPLDEAAARAFECLEDAHERGAWLSPAESAGVMAQRLEATVAHVLAQAAVMLSPARPLKGVAINATTGQAVIDFAVGEPVKITFGGPVDQDDVPTNGQADGG